MSAQSTKPLTVHRQAPRLEDMSLANLRNHLAARVASSGPNSGHCVAHIDIAGLEEAGIPAPMGGRTRIIDEYRLIKRGILQNAASETAEQRSNLVMVTSAQPGEGKTFTSISLAMSVVAETDAQVLLVDLDITKQDVCRKLGIKSDKGLLNLLDDSGLMLPQVLVRTDVPRLSMLPAGADHPLAHELLASPKMQIFMADLANWYRGGLVIIDAPPVLGAPDASVIATNVGQVILVVEANRTGRAAVAESIALLKGCEQISFVLNKVDASELVDQYGSYYGQPYHAPSSDRKLSIPERITSYVGNRLRRRHEPK